MGIPVGDEMNCEETLEFMVIVPVYTYKVLLLTVVLSFFFSIVMEPVRKRQRA